jgi:hypothetical protein
MSLPAKYEKFFAAWRRTRAGQADNFPARESFASSFATALTQRQKKTITSSSSRRFGKVENRENAFRLMSLREKSARKTGLGGRLVGG